MLPLSLYIHMPWCIQKCPYCDFNSHKSPEILPEHQYVQALIADLTEDLSRVQTRELVSIFIGGGTPSLFSAEAYERLLSQIKTMLPPSKQIEITLEANPGSVEQQRFTDYRQLGINRLSLGIQSFNPTHLKALGRIHNDKQAHQAIEAARNAGFNNINLDLMHGLPNQSISEGLADLKSALAHQPEHLSWYQLTIEPNTVFYKQKPSLPSEDELSLLEEQGFELLKEAQFNRYEISAFSKANQQAQHNLNYWLFGDYLGIGAGAHGKITSSLGVQRIQKQRQPKEYLNDAKPFVVNTHWVSNDELLFEFMLNTTRLEQPISLELFSQTTGLKKEILLAKLEIAKNKNLISLTNTHWQVTPLGRRFTNDLQALFF